MIRSTRYVFLVCTIVSVLIGLYFTISNMRVQGFTVGRLGKGTTGTADNYTAFLIAGTTALFWLSCEWEIRTSKRKNKLPPTKNSGRKH